MEKLNVLYEKDVWIKAPRTTSAIIEELTRLQEVSCTKVKDKYKGLDKIITRKKLTLFLWLVKKMR